MAGSSANAPSLRLVPVAAEHVSLLQQLRNDPTTRLYNPVQPISDEEMLRRIERESRPLCEASGTDFRWVVMEGDVPVGNVSLKEVQWSHRLIEIGMGVAREHRGRGLATAAVRLGLQMAFEDAGMERVWATSHVDNVASHRALTRAGMQREGLLRGHYLIGGQRIDHVVFGVLRSEWAPTTR